ncbi:putative aldouronate transport system permease protein [Actinacidiphila alni]|uniref:Putative aldouronate transport system permease protein n=1 Tax=Actinacidiphila alni TaxID=380248 RepID=A0A1I2DPG4_9ACTN|nr:carbohydrate ABC transporter permease [Actinacidiphila alni]SFE81830.1 putative aldouronate transport system permease protein [Actinacidiphila alni]
MTLTDTPPRRRRTVEPFAVASLVVVSGFALFCLLPIWMVIASSFTDESRLVRSGYSFFPTKFSLASYRSIFTESAIRDAYVSSLFITVVGTAVALTATTGMAWVISRRVPRISAFFGTLTYLPMLFVGGLVPFYILVTQYLHLENTYWAVILPMAVSPFLVFIEAAFFRQIPEEILESARMDGAGELRTFVRIVLPLSKPILAVVGLFYATAFWNEWFIPLLFITDEHKFPLQLLLQNLIGNVNAAQALQTGSAAAPVYQLRMALTVVTVGPILLAYPFAQRYFVRGLTLGATKG